jgi:hypothetical protein
MGRSFAYLGIPPLHVFIGEIVLFSFLLFAPRCSGVRWTRVALKQESFRRYRKAFLIFFFYGIFEVVRGIASGYPLLLAIRDLALNYYPFYFLLGLWVGVSEPEYLARTLRFAAWMNGIYGFLFVLVLSRIPWSFRGEGVEPVFVFGWPTFSGVIILGLLAFERDLRKVWIPLLLNSVALIGMLIRAEWLAFAVGLVIWAWATKKLGRLAVAAGVLAGIFILMYIANFTYEGPETRGGRISARDIVGRAIAPMNPDLASDYTTDVQQFEDTAVWRTLYWVAVWSAVHENRKTALFGLGYGFPLNELVSDLINNTARTPHNLFFFLLAYTGWIGVIVFGVFQWELGRLLWQSYRITGQPYPIIFWIAILSFAGFFPLFETPYGAIPFFVIVGCGCAPLLRLTRPESSMKIASDGSMPAGFAAPRRAAPLSPQPGLEGSK